MSKMGSSGHCPVCGFDLVCAECAELRARIQAGVRECKIRKQLLSYDNDKDMNAVIAVLEREGGATASATCIWTFDLDGFWRTECGQAWSFEHGDPDYNGVKFCQGCGRRVVVVLDEEGES